MREFEWIYVFINRHDHPKCETWIGRSCSAFHFEFLLEIVIRCCWQHYYWRQRARWTRRQTCKFKKNKKKGKNGRNGVEKYWIHFMWINCIWQLVCVPRVPSNVFQCSRNANLAPLLDINQPSAMADKIMFLNFSSTTKKINNEKALRI